MNFWQEAFLILIALYSLIAFLLGFKNTYYKKNPYGLTPFLYPLSVFVWTDAVIFGPFILLSTLVSFLSKNFTLFLLIYSVFWLVRSVGEQIYWFLEQFAVNHRNHPKTLRGNKFFPQDSVWITYQIFWQCVSVVSIIISVYLFRQILK